MTEQSLIRLALVLQNQSPSTLDKYVCKLVEAVLLNENKGLSVSEICSSINGQFTLSFTYEEIESALKKKAGKRIIETEGVYTLSLQAKEALEKAESVIDVLNGYIRQYIKDNDTSVSVDKLSKLLVKYLYYCFNSNTQNLLSLFMKGPVSVQESFDATNEEICEINSFFGWNNPKKDAFIYQFVTMCYEYCMLTIKKDNAFSKEIFQGKKFYLDANIIFRIAGINNEERRFVTQEFVDHCISAGIKLVCTSATLDEIYRVIPAQVSYIRSMCNSSKPVSVEVISRINPQIAVNDFYRIYCEWCNLHPKQCGDYMAFQQYLFGMVQRALIHLDVIEPFAYKASSRQKEFNELVDDLKRYKTNKRAWRIASQESAETDVTNIKNIIDLRKQGSVSFWNTNDFLVSADHLLIEWADTTFNGIPVVVLPSVWYSIILRYTGRSKDDYKSFCLFLTQRERIEHDTIIDTNRLLLSLNQRTTDKEIKEKILNEIIQNKSVYSFSDEKDYEETIERAFDKLFESYKGETQKKIQELQAEVRILQESSLKMESEETLREKLIEEAERDKTLSILAKKKAAKSVKGFRVVNRYLWIVYAIAGICILTVFFGWMFDWEAYNWFIACLPDKVETSAGNIDGLWAIFSAAMVLLVTAIKMLFTTLSSEEREQKLTKKFMKKSQNAINEENELGF